MNLGIKILSAKHLHAYKIEFTFSDGKVNTFDYHKLVMRDHEEAFPYREIEKFKDFQLINNTTIAWGENWDLILPLHTIYYEKEL